jgi:hypothetical protein
VQSLKKKHPSENGTDAFIAFSASILYIQIASFLLPTQQQIDTVGHELR